MDAQMEFIQQSAKIQGELGSLETSAMMAQERLSRQSDVFASDIEKKAKELNGLNGLLAGVSILAGLLTFGFAGVAGSAGMMRGSFAKSLLASPMAQAIGGCSIAATSIAIAGLKIKSATVQRDLAWDTSLLTGLAQKAPNKEIDTIKAYQDALQEASSQINRFLQSLKSIVSK